MRTLHIEGKDTLHILAWREIYTIWKNARTPANMSQTEWKASL